MSSKQVHIEMKTVARGPDFNADPGQRIHVDADRAAALIAGGHAELVEAADAREDAQAEARETAVSPAARKRARR